MKQHNLPCAYDVALSMDSDLHLALLEGEVAALTHPFGSHGFVEPLKRRSELPARSAVAYGEHSLVDDEDPEPMAEAEEPSTKAEEESQAADGSAHQADAPGDGKRKRGPAIIRSVRLPNWMDLDQESLPHGGPPVALVDTKVKRSTKVEKPAKLDDFGAVGELTVQLRTSQPDLPFDQLLTSHRAEQARGRQPPPGYVCNRCRVPGHFITECPKVEETVTRPAAPPPSIRQQRPSARMDV